MLTESKAEFAGAATNSSNTLKAWTVCLTAGLFFFYGFIQMNLFDVINQPLRQAFNINAAELSLMSSMYLWADIALLIPVGILLDRYSTRKIMLAAMLLCLFGTFGFAWSNSFGVATFFHACAGASTAVCFLACVILTSRWFPPRRQAFVIGCLTTMAFAGGMVAHTPLAVLNSLVGWRNSVLLDGALGCLMLVWFYYVIQDAPEGNMEPGARSAQAPAADFRAVLFNRQNLLPGLYTSLLNLPILVLCTLWGGSYLQIVHGVSELGASNIVNMILLGSIFGSPLAGWLSDTTGARKPVMLAGAVATLLLIIPLFLEIDLSASMLAALFFCWGLFTSTQVVSYPLIAESNAPVNTGLATSIASMIIMGGGALAQMLFGALLQHHAGSEIFAAADLQFAMWMFPLTTVLALVAVLFTRETFCKRTVGEINGVRD